MYDLDSFRDLRRVPDHTRTAHSLKSIQDVHHGIKRMLFLGHTNKRIAEVYGISESTVSQIKNSPIIKQQLKLMQASADKETLDLHAQIAAIAPAALANIREVVETGSLNGEDVNARAVLRESNNILDRHMGKAAQTIKGLHAHAHFTAEDIKQLRETAMAEAGVIDV